MRNLVRSFCLHLQKSEQQACRVCSACVALVSGRLRVCMLCLLYMWTGAVLSRQACLFVRQSMCCLGLLDPAQGCKCSNLLNGLMPWVRGISSMACFLCRSKSLGNFFTIQEVLKQYHPMALRWFLINTHYRQHVNYTINALQEASDRIYYICETLQSVCKVLQDAGVLPTIWICTSGGMWVTNRPQVDDLWIG